MTTYREALLGWDCKQISLQSRIWGWAAYRFKGAFAAHDEIWWQYWRDDASLIWC